MRRPIICILSAILISACNASDAAIGVNERDTDRQAVNPPGSFVRVDLGTLGGASSYATGINNSGVVVGWSQTSGGETHAFRWTGSAGMVDLGTLPGDRASRAIAILDTQNSGDAEILGVSGDGTNWAPVVWTASGAITRLEVPSPQEFSTRLPTAFNSQGEVVGWDAADGYQHGWIWSAEDGEFDLSTNLSAKRGEGSAAAITASGRVLLTTASTSCARTLECWRTYVWTKGSGYAPLGTPTVDGEANVTGLDLNDLGTVVGWASIGSGGSPTPYTWSAAHGFRLLAHYTTGANQYGYATAVNSGASVVGADFDPATGSIVASFWSPVGGITKLSSGDSNPSVAIGINDVGTVAGWATVAAGANHAVVWRPGSSAGSNLVAPTTIALVRVAPKSTTCLTSASAVLSRHAMFDCVAKADRLR